MKNKRFYNKIASLVLLFALILTTVASAATFTDISKHWAKEYIEKVAKNGLVEGFTDKTFRPEEHVTVLQSLVMMSRLYNIKDNVKKQIIEDHKDFLENLPKSKDFKWSFDYLALALEFGIVTEDSLYKLFKDESISQDATKEMIAIFLTKALNLNDEAKNLKAYTLPFNDVEKISNDEVRKYIYVMYDKGILTGDTAKNINSKSTVTRAVMSTMMDRAYEYIKENKIEPPFSSYKDTTSIIGLITKIEKDKSDYKVFIEKDNEDIINIKLTNDTKVYLNNKISELDKIKKDMIAKIDITEDSSVVRIYVEDSYNVIRGTIVSVEYSRSPYIITVENEKKEKLKYEIEEDSLIYLDGKEILLNKLVKGDDVRLLEKSNRVYQINSTSKVQRYQGIVSDINYSAYPIKFEIKFENSEVMTFEYLSNVDVVKNEKSSTFDQIMIKDEVIAIVENGKLVKLDAKSSEAEISGKIKEIFIGDTNTLKIEDENGYINNYIVNKNVAITIGNIKGSIYDLRVDYYVDMNTSGDEIITIDALDMEIGKNFTGKVISVNDKENTLMMQNVKSSEQTELIILKTTNSTRIVDTSFNSKYLKDIKEGSNIVVTALSRDGEYIAISIIMP